MLSIKDIRFLSGQLNHDLREPINFISRKLELIEVMQSPGKSVSIGQQNYIKFVRDRCSTILGKIKSLRDDVVGDRVGENTFMLRLDQIVLDASRLSSFANRSSSIWPDPNEEQERLINQIRSTSSRFLRMLRALLTVANINEPAFVKTNFRNQAITAAAYIVERFSLQVGREISERAFVWDESRASGIADQGMILTIFQNIYENSVKYRSPERELRITTHFEEIIFAQIRSSYDSLSAYEFKGKDLIHVVITDNGVGIPPSSIKTIFDAYTQVSAHRKDVFLPGLQIIQDTDKDVGIGLYTVRKMMAIHGGFIFAASDGRSGSQFHLLFPPFQ